MLKNNNFNRVLAVIVAIVLWVYVVGEVNPADDAVIEDVPITFTNQDDLEANGLAVLSSSEHSININISGQRAVVSKVEASDFSVICDVSSLKKGDNFVKLQIDGPSDVKIDHVSTEKITVVIDEKITAEKPVKVVINGDVESDKEVSVQDVNKTTIRVEGPMTSVNKITNMVAYLDSTEVTSESKEFTVDVVPVDYSGNMIERVESLDGNEVKVTAVLLQIKTVDLEVPVINQNTGNIERTYSAPESIVIKGTESSLSKVNSIKCKNVDLKDITMDTTIALNPILPEGVKIASASEGLSMSVTVQNGAKKTFEISKDAITLTGKKEDVEYNVEDVKYTVEVAGKASVVNSLSPEDISITADVSDLDEGKGSVKLTATCSKELQSITITPSKANITIS